MPGDVTRLDLNSATREELTELTGIGGALADRIIAHRTRIGGFESVEAIEHVNGVSERLAARLELLKPEERLSPEGLMSDLKNAGKDAAYLPDADAIVAHMATKVQGGDIICVFSNGGFGDIHSKLLARLGRR